MKVHPDLRRIVMVYLILGPAFMATGVAVVGLVISPYREWLGLPVTCLGLYGMISIVLGWLMFSIAPMWYRRATWVLGNVQSEPVRFRLQDTGSTDNPSIKAEILSEKGDIVSTVTLLRPSWDLKSLGNFTGHIYRDPKRGGPTVISTEQGLLWQVPSRGSAVGQMEKMGNVGK